MKGDVNKLVGEITGKYGKCLGILIWLGAHFWYKGKVDLQISS